MIASSTPVVVAAVMMLLMMMAMITSYIEDPKPCDCGWHMLFGAE